MPRREFSKTVKVAVIKRAKKDGVVYCEKCQLPTQLFEIDHCRPDGLLGEPTIANAMLLCVGCHKEKTASDVAAIAKAKRVEANHLGVKTVLVKKLQSRGFAKSEKAAKRQSKEPMRGQSAFARQILNED